MLEINLLPEELKLSAAKRLNAGSHNLLLLIVPVIVIILVLLHAFSGTMFWMRTSGMAALKKESKSLEPQRQTLAALKNSFASYSLEEGIIRNLLGSSVNWSKVLYKISLYLPQEMWFTELMVKPQRVELSGSVVNLGQDELDTINRFVSSLKGDLECAEVFSGFEPGPIRKVINGSYTIANFMLYLNVKNKS